MSARAQSMHFLCIATVTKHLLEMRRKFENYSEHVLLFDIEIDLQTRNIHCCHTDKKNCYTLRENSYLAAIKVTHPEHVLYFLSKVCVLEHSVVVPASVLGLNYEPL